MLADVSPDEFGRWFYALLGFMGFIALAVTIAVKVKELLNRKPDPPSREEHNVLVMRVAVNEERLTRLVDDQAKFAAIQRESNRDLQDELQRLALAVERMDETIRNLMTR